MSVKLGIIGEEVLQRRYLDDETVDEMFRRVARVVAGAEAEYGGSIGEAEEEFYQLISTLRFLPNSPTLSNAGKGHGQLSACYVLPVPDSIEGIFDAVKHAALIHRTGGGTGFSFSRLRSEGSRVNSTGREASGPVSFMRVFDRATESIKQGGYRRGANMGILHIDHPDILQFIRMKNDGSLQNFNISVAMTDEFMEGISGGFSTKNWSYYDLEKGSKKLFGEIAQNAWATGDPGLFFIDRVNSGRANPVPKYGPIEATNPCGEMPLYPYDSCNLGSINLSLFVVSTPDTKVDPGCYVDWDGLRATVRSAVHFLDNVIDVNQYPLPECAALNQQIRRIGLGVMGWAEMCFKLRIPYGSEAACNLAETIMSFIQICAEEMTVKLATKRGPFPAFNESIYSKGPTRRNSTLTSIAPTGTISMIAGTSSGIEPLFALVMKRKHRLGEGGDAQFTMVDANQVFANEVAEWYNHDSYSLEIMQALEEGAHLSDLYVPDWMRSTFVTAHDVSIEGHINTQAAFQKYTDNAVSKTINMKNEATVEDVKQAYIQAYKKGLNGITIYRDGSHVDQVLSTIDNNEAGYGCCDQPDVIKRDGCHYCTNCEATFC